MADQRQPVIRTIPTAAVFSTAVIDGWYAVTDEGGIPTKQAVGVLFAHYMIETGGLHCYGWNIGNVKHVPGRGYDYHCLRGVWEGETPTNAKALIARGEATLDPNKSHQKSCAPNISVVYEPPHVMTRFTVFPNLSDAMDDHLILLCKKRYASAWPAVLSGDVVKFAYALKAKGYYTSTAKAYAQGMAPAFKHFMASRDYENAVEASLKDVTEPVFEFSGGIIHPMPEREPMVYDSDDMLDAVREVKPMPWWHRLFRVA